MTTGRPFARRVAGVFTARAVQFAIGMATSFLLSRLLGPAGRGAFALATLVPSTLFALGQLGLPSAFSFFAGRGRPGRTLWRLAIGTAAGLATVLLLGALLALPALEASVLEAAPADLVRIALLSLPFQFLASFLGAILIGRQTLLAYNLVLIGQSALALVLVIVLVGVAGLGPVGAVLGSLVVAVAGAVATLVVTRRSTSEAEEGRATRLGELAGFGIRLYPASVTSFFSYRVDIFLLGFFLGGRDDAVAAQIGLYTLAVSLAELTFFVPDSVATVFFPRIAGAERRTADELTPMVSRMTVLVTVIAVAALVPAAFVAVHVILPAFTGSLTPFLLLLPAVVTLAVAKVLSSYISGLGRPLPVAVAAVTALVVNVVANVILIPLLGINGAAIASIVSYGVNTGILLVVAVRLLRRSTGALLVPSGAEVERLITVARAALRRLDRRATR